MSRAVPGSHDGTTPAPPRAVVTGIGVVAPNGFDADEYWDAVLHGRGGIDRITRFDPAQYPATLAGEVPDYDVRAYIPSRLVPQTDQTTRLVLIAADAAVRDSALDPAALPDDQVGIVTGLSAGGLEYSQRELEKLWSLGSDHVSAYLSFSWFYAVNTGQISIRHGWHGPGGVLTGNTSGLDAMAQARRYVADGLPVVMCGAVESAMCPLGLAIELTTGRMSTVDDRTRAYLPFDTAASGYVPGEGGAMVVVEEVGHANGRGVQPYCEIAGYATTFDPRPGSAREPGLRRAIESALSDAGVTPAEVDVVFADAAGVGELDRAEATAVTAVFGPRGVPVTAPKTMTGRLYSGGPALDVATASLSMRHGVIPPMINVTDPVRSDQLDLVLGRPRDTTVSTALVLARSDGINSAMVLKAV
ncbi:MULTISPECIES: ketosynthase chain-length factor [Streptomyces]|uniref:Ketosynthase chain-length factor n=1 Tax=Streptomyces flavovirens TaxID=52258 RepID=A0ABV8N529_9ACTN|nr:ketosynthase chain-length factor [Streptomyces sp. MBT51]MBK3595614.1 ketosynthase chain-length factor [Streptomyces sp. MBT51]HBF82692.1 ketosynthase chain-length factor [Streptomyces sp.]